MSGRLITLEGIDGSGKSTITGILKSYFKDDETILFTREPTGGWIGEAVYRAIRSDVDPLAELFLFIADHADHLSTTIRPALEKNMIVISDRYSDSRYAYQGATLNQMFDDPLQWVIDLHRGWTIIPDLTILFDIDPHEAVTRVCNRDHQTKFEKIHFLEEVRENYRRLADMEPDRYLVIDAGQPLKTVKQQVQKAVIGQLRSG